MKHTKEEIALNSLEAKTLLRIFEYPIVMVTFKGDKEPTGIRFTTYKIHTPEETIDKDKIIYAYMKKHKTALNEQIKVENTIKKIRLQTRVKINERPTLPIEDALKETHNTPVTVTMMNGQLLQGKLTNYDQYNLTLDINSIPVLLYRHAIYRFQDIQQIPIYTYRDRKDIDGFIQKVLKDFIKTEQKRLTICYKGIGQKDAEPITERLQAHIPAVEIERRYT